MSKKMLLGVLAAVMLSGEISASPVLAQNLYADRDVTEIMETEEDAAETEHVFSVGNALEDKNGFVIENGVLTDYRGYETEIAIPAGVTSIGESAFEGKDIESVKVPDGVTALGYRAFYHCTKLKSVELPKTLQTIASYAFRSCENLESITVSGTSAKKGTVMIPGSVTEMKDFTFGGSDLITELDITTSTAVISNRIVDLPNVNTVKATGSTKYKVQDNILYDKSVEDLYYFPQGSSKTQVILPEGVEVIEEAAFYNCKNIGNITLPQTLWKIEDMALWGCEKIKKLELTSKISSVGSYVFRDCKALEEIIVVPENTYFKSVDGILYEKKKYMRMMVCPAMKQGIVTVADGMHEIGTEAFHDCKYVTEVRLPESLETINSSAFEGCSALEKIELPDNIEQIGMYAFEDCTALKSVKLPARLTDIDQAVFAGCESLENIVIPEGVTSIKYRAFDGCDNLQYAIIPASVTSIEDGAFETGRRDRDLLIYCKEGTCAESYAKENDISYAYGNTAKKRQTITANDFEKMYGDESFYIQAATDGDGKLTYKVKDESVVTVSADGKVTIKGTGTTDVVITVARTDAYEWASKTIHISVRGVVKKKSQTITVADIISIYEGNTVALDAATDGDGTISYVSDDKTVASVDASGKVCGIKQGTAHITVLASETELYHASETIVTVTVKPKKTQSNTDPGKKPSDNVSKDDSQTTEDKKPSNGGNNTSGTTDGQQTKKKQTIKAKNITKTYSTKTFSIGAKTNGGGKLTYKVADKKIATISKTGKIKLKNYGQTKITIKAAAKGKYKAATKTITLTVKPVKVKVTSVKQLKAKTLQVKWKKDKKASGYIIQYSTDKKFKKNVKKAVVTKNQTVTKKITKLKPGKKYYVRVCAYKNSHGKKVQGSYGTVKSVKLK